MTLFNHTGSLLVPCFQLSFPAPHNVPFYSVQRLEDKPINVHVYNNSWCVGEHSDNPGELPAQSLNPNFAQDNPRILGLYRSELWLWGGRFEHPPIEGWQLKNASGSMRYRKRGPMNGGSWKSSMIFLTPCSVCKWRKSNKFLQESGLKVGREMGSAP